MDKYGVLARDAPTDTNWNDLYTCPVAAATTYESGAIRVEPQSVAQSTETLISSIAVCRLAATGGGALYFSIAVVDSAGDAPTNDDYIVYQQDIAGGTTKVISLGMTLQAGETLRVQLETADSINFVVSGVEIT